MPIIATAQLDDNSTSRWDRLRKMHFPAERNFLAAHVTLFHSLNERQAAAIEALPLPPAFPVTFSGVRFLGRGVAISIVSPQLAALREQLHAVAGGPFTRQDDQPFRPHITIQNKVAPEEARNLFNSMSQSFVPSTGTCIGVQLWEYLGGPWGLLKTLPLPSE